MYSGLSIIKMLSTSLLGIHIPKSYNQSAVFIGYDILIGCFSSMSTSIKLVLVLLPWDQAYKYISINFTLMKYVLIQNSDLFVTENSY